MRVKCRKVSLTALLLLLFLFSISLAWGRSPSRSSGKSTGNTWDEKSQGGGLIFSGKHCFFGTGYYVIFADPYAVVVLDFSQIAKNNSSNNVAKTNNTAQ